MRVLMAVSCLYGCLAVALGAFGAHALDTWFDENPGYEDWWQTGSHYHLLHAVVALIAARMGSRGACLSFLIGITIFSGSLYILTLTGTRAWGAVTPVGGVALIVGWLILARAALVGSHEREATSDVTSASHVE